MALARVKTWIAGDTLTAADQNAEFNNILNNPISLISPSTGAINFQTSVAHTNLVVGALTASSGFAGSVLVATTGATTAQWSTGAVTGGVFIATTASIPTWLAQGTTGQALIVSSSGGAVWGGPSICKGWATVSSSGSVTGTGFNVSSATVNAAGDYTVTWNTAMPTASYGPITGCRVASCDGTTSLLTVVTSVSTNTTRVVTFTIGGTLVHTQGVSVAIYSQ